MAIGFIAAVLVVILGSARRGKDMLRLPDGRAVRIRAISYGTNHPFVDGPVWLKIARPWISPQRSLALGLRTFNHPTQRPVMVIWTEWELPSTNSSVARGASLRTESGIQSEPIGATTWGSLDATRRRTIAAWSFSNLPRGERRIEVTWYDRDQGYQPIRLGQLSVSNPARSGGRGVSPAEPLPQTAVRGSTRFTLEALGVGRPAPAVRPQPVNMPRKISPGGFIQVSIRVGDKLSDDWEPRGITASSPGGNWFAYGAPAWSRISPGNFRFNFDDVLWPDESAWKFDVEFTRRGGFETAQLWTAPALKSPSRDQDVQQPVQATREGLELLGMMARGIPSGVSGFNLDFQPNAHLVLQFDRPADAASVRLALATVVDEQGQPLRHTPGRETTSNTLVADISIRDGVQSLTPTFAIHRGVTIEFLAQIPQELK